MKKATPTSLIALPLPVHTFLLLHNHVPSFYCKKLKHALLEITMNSKIRICLVYYHQVHDHLDY